MTISHALDACKTRSGRLDANGQTFIPSLTATNDPSRSPQAQEITRQVEAMASAGAGVRRLTPTECERLQALPDGWTAPEGVKCPDSRRYAALGDAVTASVARWIGERILAHLGQNGGIRPPDRRWANL